VTRISLTILT